jgi:hypothetical protein
LQPHFEQHSSLEFFVGETREKNMPQLSLIQSPKIKIACNKKQKLFKEETEVTRK